MKVKGLIAAVTGCSILGFIMWLAIDQPSLGAVVGKIFLFIVLFTLVAGVCYSMATDDTWL